MQCYRNNTSRIFTHKNRHRTLAGLTASDFMTGIDNFIKALHFEVVSKIHFLEWTLLGDVILCDGWVPQS
jgi:hypothetical protein